MEWFNKFKVGQDVKVVKKVDSWPGASWVSEMDKTINKIYKIKVVDGYIGYLLDVTNDVGRTYWYPSESLACVAGQQLLFDFMSEAT